MSSPRLCPASSNILTLRDEDLGNLHENDTDSNSNSNQTKKLVERRIDIYLGCNFTSRDPGNYNCKLQVVTWKNGTTALCGSCSFCNLLEDSMQQSVESDLWNAWRLGDKLSPALWPRPLNIRAVTHFEKLEYRMELENAKDSTPWAIDAEAGNWSVYSSLLTGYVLLCPTSMNSGEEWKRVEVCVAFEIFGEEDDPVARLLKVHRRPLNGPFLSDQNVSKIRNWIKDCDEHHDGCCADLKQLASIEAGTFLPTRLVDIGGFVDDIHHPRLVITSEMQPKSSEDRVTKYIALSYCWGPVDGTTKLLKTTRKTIGSRTQKIELETMPQTFQDAVLVARTLGIQYLWIDSLCIIQDNSRDWQIESSKMPEVFSNAYLTLIAASASNCNDSFLSRRIPRLSCTVSLTLSQDSGAPISGQFSLRFRHRWNTTDKMAEISGSKWVTRGWTFQEERLARRVLMFGEKKFFFDCRTLERAEDTERYTSRPDWVTSVTPFEIPREVPEVNLATTTEVDSHWNHWQALCSHYAYRELTFPEDKLPAISGIASMLSQKVQSSYLAGLWRENLVHDLFWQTTAAAVATRPPKYRAPSWSWASLDGWIGWPSWQLCLECNKCAMYCKILEVQTTPMGLDPYGAVKDGFLKVQGVLKEMNVVWVGGDTSPYSWRLEYKGEQIGYANFDIENEDMKVHGRENIYHAILVAQCKSWKKNKTLARGLLLERVGYQQENYHEFERRGVFNLSSDITPHEYGRSSIWKSGEEQVIMIT